MREERTTERIEGMTITEFLLARIDEDEKYARAAGGRRWASWNRSWDATPSRDIADGTERLFPVPTQYDEHVAQWDPARVLAECEAKRRIVERLAQAERLCEANAEEHAKASRGGLDNQEQITALRTHGWELRGRLEALRYLVDVFASVYVDHPDYDEAWAV